MTDAIPDEDMGKYLTAFADGELDGGEFEAVVHYLARTPQAASRVVAQHRLRAAAERQLKAIVPPVPQELRDRIEGLAPRPVAGGNPERAAGPAARSGRGRRWLAAAASVGLAAGVLLGRLSVRSNAGHAAVRPADGVPAPLFAAAARTHVNCARFADHAHEPQFPREVGRLPDAMRRHLARAVPYPDLSGIGFAFAGAGPCELPGGVPTVHLLYRRDRGGVRDTVSLFVLPDAGQLRSGPGVVHDVAAPEAAHPTYAWRTGEVLYVLIGDDRGAVEQARGRVAAGLPAAVPANG